MIPQWGDSLVKAATDEVQEYKMFMHKHGAKDKQYKYMVVLLELCFTTTQDLLSSSASWSPLSPRLFCPSYPSFPRHPTLGWSVLAVPNFFHLRIMEVTVLGKLQRSRKPFTDLCLATILSLKALPLTS